MPIYEEYMELSSLLTFELGQDREPSDSVPFILAEFARSTSQEEKDKLFREMDQFTERFHNCLDEALLRWFGGGSIKLFDMIRAIVNDPDSYKQFDDAGNIRPSSE